MLYGGSKTYTTCGWSPDRLAQWTAIHCIYVVGESNSDVLVVNLGSCGVLYGAVRPLICGLGLGCAPGDVIWSGSIGGAVRCGVLYEAVKPLICGLGLGCAPGDVIWSGSIGGAVRCGVLYEAVKPLICGLGLGCAPGDVIWSGSIGGGVMAFSGS